MNILKKLKISQKYGSVQYAGALKAGSDITVFLVQD